MTGLGGLTSVSDSKITVDNILKNFRESSDWDNVKVQ